MEVKVTVDEREELKALLPSNGAGQLTPHVEDHPSVLSAVSSDSPPHNPHQELNAGVNNIKLYIFVSVFVSIVGQLIMEAHPCPASDRHVSLNDCSPAAHSVLRIPLNTASQPHSCCQVDIR